MIQKRGLQPARSAPEANPIRFPPLGRNRPAGIAALADLGDRSPCYEVSQDRKQHPHNGFLRALRQSLGAYRVQGNVAQRYRLLGLPERVQRKPGQFLGREVIGPPIVTALRNPVWMVRG